MDSLFAFHTLGIKRDSAIISLDAPPYEHSIEARPGECKGNCSTLSGFPLGRTWLGGCVCPPTPQPYFFFPSCSSCAPCYDDDFVQVSHFIIQIRWIGKSFSFDVTLSKPSRSASSA